MAGVLDGIRVIDMAGRAVSPPGGDAREVLALIGMEDKLKDLVRKRVIALD